MLLSDNLFVARQTEVLVVAKYEALLTLINVKDRQKKEIPLLILMATYGCHRSVLLRPAVTQCPQPRSERSWPSSVLFGQFFVTGPNEVLLAVNTHGQVLFLSSPDRLRLSSLSQNARSDMMRRLVLLQDVGVLLSALTWPCPLSSSWA